MALFPKLNLHKSKSSERQAADDFEEVPLYVLEGRCRAVIVEGRISGIELTLPSAQYELSLLLTKENKELHLLTAMISPTKIFRLAFKTFDVAPEPEDEICLMIRESKAEPLTERIQLY